MRDFQASLVRFTWSIFIQSAKEKRLRLACAVAEIPKDLETSALTVVKSRLLQYHGNKVAAENVLNALGSEQGLLGQIANCKYEKLNELYQKVNKTEVTKNNYNALAKLASMCLLAVCIWRFASKPKAAIDFTSVNSVLLNPMLHFATTCLAFAKTNRFIYSAYSKGMDAHYGELFLIFSEVNLAKVIDDQISKLSGNKLTIA